jgi:eukaryotic-like serine/threonine-protein kinase
MSLTPGARLGVYEIVAPIGKGGMGEVYRARDTKLHRDVAIKVLPDAFAQDRERLARFEREARTLAALNHPNIAHVYGVEEGALVMECVDGEDLAARIARAGSLPIEDALPIALQIAEGLESAHAQGIVHRDLKPANVKVRDDGAVTILDFGLAKALAPPDAGRSQPLADSPTITTPFQMSALGVILGTASYMAPEQARGRPLDKRVDIWAFGCVLYEMLTARRAFPGDDVTETLASVIRADPDWTALPAATPASIRTLLRRCLEKNPRDRLPDIGAARLELKDARPDAGVSGTSAVPPRAPRTTAWLPWTITAAAVAAALGMAAVVALRNRPAPDAQVYRLEMVPPASLANAPALRFALSPDGSRIAFVAANSNGDTVVWIRRLSESIARQLPGTVNASNPFWSYDGRSVAFAADGRLRIVDADGGPVQTLTNANSAPAGTWNRDNVLIVTGPVAGGLIRIAATGGQPAAAVAESSNKANTIAIAPFFLPDQRHFLFTVTTAGGGTAGVGVYVGSLDSKDAKRILDVGSNAMYADGYLLFLRGASLMAQPFDPDSLSLSGTAVTVATDVQINPATGTGAFSVSRTGMLAYQTGPSSGTQLTWLDRTGKVLGTIGPPAGVRDVELSPDGQWASMTLTDERGDSPNVYLFDLARGFSRRITFGDGGFGAIWSPDGRTLVYAATRVERATDLLERPVSGTAGERVLWHDDDMKYPLSMSPDGKFLLYAVQKTVNIGRMKLLSLPGGQPTDIVQDSDNQIPGEISPDGHWLAYASSETGRREVFVTPFPQGRGKWQITTNGGDRPRWRPGSTNELYLINGERFMVVQTTPQPDRFDFGPPRDLFEVHVPATQLGTRSAYAIQRDGQRFLFNTWDAKAASAPISLVVNWTQSLKK